MLKTAEELKIKGLAEVSWRSDQEQQNQSFNVTTDESSISKKRKLDTTPNTNTNIKKEFTEKQQVIFQMYIVIVIIIYLIFRKMMIWMEKI